MKILTGNRIPFLMRSWVHRWSRDVVAERGWRSECPGRARWELASQSVMASWGWNWAVSCVPKHPTTSQKLLMNANDFFVYTISSNSTPFTKTSKLQLLCLSLPACCLSFPWWNWHKTEFQWFPSQFGCFPIQYHQVRNNIQTSSEHTISTTSVYLNHISPISSSASRNHLSMPTVPHFWNCLRGLWPEEIIDQWICPMDAIG